MFWRQGVTSSLRWRRNGRDSASNHQPHDCLLNRLFRRRSKEISKLCVTGLCAGNSPGTGEFPAQMASNAENVFIWWRHHVGNMESAESSSSPNKARIYTDHEIQHLLVFNLLDKFSYKAWPGTALTNMDLMPAWLSNRTPSKVWDEITYPFPNYNVCAVEVGVGLVI